MGVNASNSPIGVSAELVRDRAGVCFSVRAFDFQNGKLFNGQHSVVLQAHEYEGRGHTSGSYEKHVVLHREGSVACAAIQNIRLACRVGASKCSRSTRRIHQHSANAWLASGAASLTSQASIASLHVPSLRLS